MEEDGTKLADYLRNTALVVVTGRSYMPAEEARITEAGLGAGWYALYTRHQHEKNVARALAGKEFEVFLPLYTAVHRWKDRDKALSLPLFPCYVFLRNPLERWHPVLATPGVHSVVGF